MAPEPDSAVTIRRHGPEAALGLAEQVRPCCREAFGDLEDFPSWYTGMFAVLARCRRGGTGGLLHDALPDGVTARALLSTADDPADPVGRLYRSRGWRELGLPRPGVQVMGRDV